MESSTEWQDLPGFDVSDESYANDKPNIGRLEAVDGVYRHTCQNGASVQISDAPEKASNFSLHCDSVLDPTLIHLLSNLGESHHHQIHGSYRQCTSLVLLRSALLCKFNLWLWLLKQSQCQISTINVVNPYLEVAAPLNTATNLALKSLYDSIWLTEDPSKTVSLIRMMHRACCLPWELRQLWCQSIPPFPDPIVERVVLL